MLDVRQTVSTVGSTLLGSLGRLVPWSDPAESSVSRPDVFENASDGYILLDDGVVVETNAATARLLGPGAVTRGDDLATTLPALAPLVGTTPQTQTEIRPDSSGEPLIARRVTLSADATAETLVVIHERTATHRNETRYRGFLEHSSELVFVLDTDGVVTFAGPSCQRLIGDGSASATGTEIITKIHPDDRDEFRQGLQRLLDDPETEQGFEFRLQTADDEWRIVDGHGRNLLDDRAVEGLFLAVRDVTERKQREHDLERQNERLQQFADVLSHDLRSPLQVATLSLDRAERTGEAEAFEKTAQAHDRMETMIQNVLTLARQGQRIDEVTTVSLDAVARDAWETVDTRGLTLSVDRDFELDADRDRLQRLFENLFRNAVEHGSTSNRTQSDDAVEHGSTSPDDVESTRELTVTVGPIDPLHTTTRISGRAGSGFYVADDGPGIPEDTRESVFESGFTTEESGTGFGLAIVAEIAEAHHWEPTVTDSRDGGARFEFVERPADYYLQE
jgi:PAS domain S-box-containing protein